MKNMFIITGSTGHLGSALINKLSNKNCDVRALKLPNEEIKFKAKNITYFDGDVTQIETLYPLFNNTQDYDVYVIHCAGIVDINDEVSPIMYDVNVKGTLNIINICKENNVKKLVYVSSVHAIPEYDKISVIKEISDFSPDNVCGGYAKTKAEATNLVMNEIQNGLNAVIVHPSGIIGPFDKANNHLVQLISDYINGKLLACVKGGYDFVDVRDVAQGCILAAFKGNIGNCYILSNRHYEIKDIINMLKKIINGKRITTLPMFVAKMFEPLIKTYCKIKKQRPLYTKYSLSVLQSNSKFSHDKATSELGYKPRDLFETLKDTVKWQQLQVKKATNC